ncbi:MAG: NAD-dependent epimerase/dehydratase family protein [Clostridiales bacterium]|nr:NAD-dependent epimerase/dehydratase family protein [Clostridiales bacterium]
MKIVVLGGTGNISTSIVKLLLEKGHDVTCYNRGKRGNVPKDVRLIQGDRNEREIFEKTMQSENFDVAIDMISATAEDALSSIRAFRGVGQFIQCSTTATYGIEPKWFPVSEDHPLTPVMEYGIGKVAGDKALLEAYYKEGFPVTIIRPSTTYGSQSGIFDQVACNFTWIDRIRKGKPILICGDGKALMQFLHVDDAAKGFAGVIGKQNCIGQAYNLVNRGFTTWEQHHRTAMKVLGKEVDLVGVPLKTLIAFDAPRFFILINIFAHNCYYSSDKIFRDVPEFIPAISLEEGMRQVIKYMDEKGAVPNSDLEIWEDKIIEAQLQVGRVTLL